MSKYGGMTVNERLAEAGLLSAWDEAVARRDRDGMIGILERVEMTTSQAAQTTDTVLANPGLYGFK